MTVSCSRRSQQHLDRNPGGDYISGMNDDYDTRLELAELKGDIRAIRGENEAMESRIDASLARLETGVDARLGGVDASLARLETGVDASLARLREDMARRDTEAARRDKANIQWHIALVVAMTTLIIGAIAVLP
ncbi:MAG: hypothetical protein OXC91_01640 [Rhodobacteraceae bacterium]|nr:hypothetical protein [Paracoccaceae bacterium]